MAAVRIATGPVDPSDRLADVPREDWGTLLIVRRMFLRTALPYDCRELTRFVEEAEQMYSALGYESVDDLIRRGLDTDPVRVRWAINGLRALDPSMPWSIDYAAARAQELAQDPSVKALGPAAPPKGGPSRNQAGANQHRGGKVDDINLTSEPAPASRGGTSAEYLVKRLKRDAPEVAAQLAQGVFKSARAAARAAGIIREQTRVDRALALVRKMADAELAEFETKLDELIRARHR